MSRVLTNTTSIAIAPEQSIGVLPGSPTWYQLEPNNPSQFGASIKSVARRPISQNRQQSKGAVIDLDSGFAVDHDLSHHFAQLVAEGFCFAEAANANLSFRNLPATSSGYTIPAATASQAAKLQFVTTGPKSLVFARGYAITANNGLKVLSADTAAAGVLIAVAGNSAETPPTNAIVEVAGIRAATSDLAVTVSGSTGTLTSLGGGNSIDFTTIGITAGQFIHIGGTAGAQQFSAGKGYVRVLTIAATAVTFDKLVGTLVTDPGTGDTVDLLFGRFVRNVVVSANADDNRFLERYWQAELAYPDLNAVGVPEYEYAKGNLSNELSFNIPLTEKTTVTASFVGTDTDTPSTTRKTNASTPILPLRTTAFGTASDVISLRNSATGATAAYFKRAVLTLKNNVKPEKAIGILGAAFINAGIFQVELDAEMIFTSSGVITVARNNTTVTMEAILHNDDGAIAIDIPAMTLSGGERSFPQDESVLVGFTGTAFADPTFNTSIGISFFPIVP